MQQAGDDLVIESLRKIAEHASAPETFHGATAVKAWELLGKHLGMWQDKPQQQFPDDVPFSERVKMYAMEDAMAEAANVTQFRRPNEGVAPPASADDPA